MSTDYLLGRAEPMESIPRKEDVIATETLRALNGKPVWDENKGWGIVNSIHDYVIFMDGSKIVLAEAMNLRAMAPAFTMGYSPTTKPISHEDLGKYKTIWVKPITPDSFLQDELTGWYQVHDFTSKISMAHVSCLIPMGQDGWLLQWNSKSMHR